jgi:hypothetical protein
MPSGAGITRCDEFIPFYPRQFFKKKKQVCFFENILNVIRFFSFGGGKDPMIKPCRLLHKNPKFETPLYILIFYKSFFFLFIIHKNKKYK